MLFGLFGYKVLLTTVAPSLIFYKLKIFVRLRKKKSGVRYKYTQNTQTTIKYKTLRRLRKWRGSRNNLHKSWLWTLQTDYTKD